LLNSRRLQLPSRWRSSAPIEDVAGEVEQGVPVVTPYLRKAASSIHRVSSTLRERSTVDLLQDLSEFARRRPAALVGVSLAAGFALARFLKSSADRRAASRSQGSSSRTHGQHQSGSDQPSEAELSDTPSSVAGMASLSDVTAATRKSGDASSTSAGTSAAGGGAEAPEPGRVGSI
jgi:hypothetical protein